MVREFQSVIGREVVHQAADQGKGPLKIDALVACVGGGSNAIGFFEPFLGNSSVRLIGVEAGGRGEGPGENAVRMNGQGRPGIVQGYKSHFLLDKDGQVLPTHSISAGLDYPGIGPELAELGKTNRIEFRSATDSEALEALKFFAAREGIIFAMESAHAGAAAMKLARELGPGKNLVINMSGRGDKDLFISAAALDGVNWKAFLDEEAGRIDLDSVQGGNENG
jgi:tryptophan synthase beta chain